MQHYKQRRRVRQRIAKRAQCDQRLWMTVYSVGECSNESTAEQENIDRATINLNQYRIVYKSYKNRICNLIQMLCKFNEYSNLIFQMLAKFETNCVQ